MGIIMLDLGLYGATVVLFHIISETIATLPGGWDLAHAIRLGIKPFAELGANSEALSGSQVDSPCSCRAIFESAPVVMLQSLISVVYFMVRRLVAALMA